AELWRVSLHDALPISLGLAVRVGAITRVGEGDREVDEAFAQHPERLGRLRLDVAHGEAGVRVADVAEQPRDDGRRRRRERGDARSEEHTSELQSRENL